MMAGVVSKHRPTRLSAASAEPALRGSVLDVLRTLLGDIRSATSCCRSSVSWSRTRRPRATAGAHGGEVQAERAVSKAQLVLFLDALKRGEGEDEGKPALGGEITDERAALLAATTSCAQRPESMMARMTMSPSWHAPPPRQPRSPKRRAPAASRQSDRGAGGAASLSEVRRRSRVRRAARHRSDRARAASGDRAARHPRAARVRRVRDRAGARAGGETSCRTASWGSG